MPTPTPKLTATEFTQKFENIVAPLYDFRRNHWTDFDGLRGRIGNHWFCPITAMYHYETGRFISCLDAERAAKELGLTEEETAIIMLEADFG